MCTGYTTMQKWSKGLGVRLPNEIAKIAKIPEKAKIKIIAEPEKIVITRVKETPKFDLIDLEELFKDFDGEYELDEEDRQWIDMKAVGRERFWEE